VNVNDVYHYTDEVLTLLAQAGQSTRMSLIDANGGMDWINAAALYQDLVLDLNAGGSSTLGGVRFITIDAGTAIENAVTGDGNDRINGNSLDNQLVGMQGDDVLYGALGNDTLDGGDGLDSAVFQGLSTAYAITTLNGKTVVTGADGMDWLTGIEYLVFSDKTLPDPNAGTLTPTPPVTGPGTGTGGSGSGTVSPPSPPSSTSNAMKGTAAADNLIGTAEADVIEGLAGNDTLSGGDGNDTLIGGAGNDRFSGGAGIDTISYLGTTAAVTFSLASTANQNTRGSGTDALLAGHGIENLTGGSAADNLTGDANANQIDGAAGNDTINGGLGADTLTGGLGKDFFVFNSKLGAGNTDTLVNYNVADDTIRLENTGIFTALTKTGTLAATAFTDGTGATTAAHRIIYTASSGALLYDADGTGAVAPVQFATLQGVTGTLTRADFVVI
jgi:Ca2+-binding RTX toxin-like protein